MELFKAGKILITHALYGGEILRKELHDLGYRTNHDNRLHIEITGTIKDAVSLNLHLRSAHRVLFSITSFQAKSLQDLYFQIKKIPWEEIIPLKGFFSINTFVKQNGIKDFRIVSLKTKDAIADRFMSKFRIRPDSGKETDKLVLFIHWANDFCSIYLDTSGDSIARHGYRTSSWHAPLSEALAASIVLSTNWNYKVPFINPMCGSGTLAIEAAMIATNRYPGLYRKNYSFLHVKNSPVDLYLQIKNELKDKIQIVSGLLIIGTDNQKGAIIQGMKNAENAGVGSLIKWEEGDFKTTSVPGNEGIIVLNPPYGERMGDVQILEDTYQEIGDFFKNKCQGYTGYVFTGNPLLGKKIGLRTSRKIPFMNGNIECRLLEYPLYAGSVK